jgi:hypothetical protein
MTTAALVIALCASGVFAARSLRDIWVLLAEGSPTRPDRQAGAD